MPLALIITDERSDFKMLQRFLKTISRGFCIYLLAMLNLIHAIQTQTYDWLLWVSLALVVLSLILALIGAARGGDTDAET